MMSECTEQAYRSLPYAGTVCVVKFNDKSWMGEGSAIAEVKAYHGASVDLLVANHKYTTEHLDNVRFYPLPKEAQEARP